MSRISDHRTKAGFTLVELMVAMSLSAIAFAGILSAYLFLGRSLTRLVNTQRQEVQSRGTLRRFTQDLSAAVSLTTATSTEIAFTKAVSTGTAAVSYTYSTGNGTLTRADSSGSQTLLSGLTACTLTYYNESGIAVTSSPQSVKSVELSFASAVGGANTGTRTSYSTVSPRIVLRNKPALQ